MRAAPLLRDVIDRHGGWDRWRRCSSITAGLSSAGLAFASRFQAGALLNRHIRLEPHARRLTAESYPKPGLVGTWSPGLVRIARASGEIDRERHDPRAAFASLAKHVHWDALDMLYFAGYALWNYLSFPFLLAEPGVAARVSSDPKGLPECLTLHATFPSGFPTQCREQRFHLDRESLLLRRHDYTADVIGRGAIAANVCLASEDAAGLRFYTRRRVYPRLGANLVMPWPVLVWIELTNLKVEMTERHR
jgi:hypothetical protein